MVNLLVLLTADLVPLFVMLLAPRVLVFGAGDQGQLGCGDDERECQRCSELHSIFSRERWNRM
jgi:alpha-tubulin suppressor-like RCC1 family protein